MQQGKKNAVLRKKFAQSAFTGLIGRDHEEEKEIDNVLGAMVRQGSRKPLLPCFMSGPRTGVQEPLPERLCSYHR
jgi:hypothetical protein